MTSPLDSFHSAEANHGNNGSDGALIERPTQLPSPVFQHQMPHMPSEEKPNRLREYWEIVQRRRWTVITCFVILLVSMMTATFLTTKIYRSTLTLQIEQKEYDVVTSTKGASPNDTGYYDSQTFYQTQYELLKSDALAQRVIEQLNLVSTTKPRTEGGFFGFLKKTEEPEESPQEPATGLLPSLPGVLTIAPVRNSQLVKVSFDSPDPQMAARIANEIASAFINLSLERRMEATSYARTFLQERLAQIKTKLEASEKELNAFTREEGIVKPEEKQQSPDSQALSEFTTALARAQGERIKAESLYQQASSGDVATLRAMTDSKLLQEYLTRKAKLEGDYQEGLKTYKAGYPKMQQLESQINELQNKIEQETSAALKGLKATYEAALAQEKLLNAKLRESKQVILGAQDRSFRYNLLTREVDTNRQLYDSLLQRYKEIGVAGGVGVNNITIIDKAKISRVPVKPNLVLNLLIGVALGLVCGIGLALMLDHLDDTIKSPEEMEKLLGLPVLGIIPNTKIVDNIELGLTQHLDPRSAFSEAHRSLVTSLQFSTAVGMPKILLVTSTSLAEGKSTTAQGLAIHIAQTGKNVLLIDGDLRKASLHKKLGVPNDIGLTNYLTGNAKPIDIAVACDLPHLFLIPSGPLPPNPAELLGSSKMVALLNLAAEKFDQVIIDGPPVLGLADAPLLGSLSDATIIVAEYGAISRHHALGAVKRLKSTRTHLVGGVLTKVSANSKSYGYHGYYYYYQYGETDNKRLTT